MEEIVEREVFGVDQFREASSQESVETRPVVQSENPIDQVRC